MPRFKVTVKFDRVNPETNEPEKSEREGIFEAEDAQTAEASYMLQFKNNEPTATNEEVTVQEVEDIPGTEEDIEGQDAG